MIASLIMPVHSDPRFAEKHRIIESVAVETGWTFRVPRYDPLSEPDFDVAAATESLHDVTLVIADLSRSRPSCYFELGFAEGIGKPIARMAEHGTEIHQTSDRARVIFYEGVAGFRAALITAIGARG